MAYILLLLFVQIMFSNIVKFRLQNLLQNEEEKSICDYLTKSKYDKEKRLQEMKETAEQLKVIRKGKERMVAEEKQKMRYMYILILYRHNIIFRVVN